MNSKEASQDRRVIEALEKINGFVNPELLAKWLEEQQNKTVTTWSKLSDRISRYVDGEIDFYQFLQAIKLSETWAYKGREELEAHKKYVAVIAHNKMKGVLTSFVAKYQDFFSKVPLVTTESTGMTLNQSLGMPVAKLVASGPLGGDQAIGGMISEEKIAGIFFFKDPLSSHAHAADIEALTRLCDVHQIPYATNPATAIGVLMFLQEYGTDWQLDTDEHSMVEKYKQEQAKVIQTVSK